MKILLWSIYNSNELLFGCSKKMLGTAIVNKQKIVIIIKIKKKEDLEAS